MAQDHDFVINNTLGFNVATTRERPYERATAQFRKEQFDSTPTVGDQSLTGWWTRGQLSFHRGAGVKYYEVTDGDAVLNRFQDCDSVLVGVPGEVTLAPRLNSLDISVSDAVPAPLTLGGGAYMLTGDGMRYTVDGSSIATIATSTGDIPTSVTSGGDWYYVTNGSKIERQAVDVFPRTNHVTNPSFEVDLTGWTAHSGATIAQSSSSAKYGSYAMRCTLSSPGSGQYVSATLTGLAVGEDYLISGWLRKVSGGDAYLIWGLDFDDTVGSPVTTSSWTRVYATFTATSTTQELALGTMSSSATVFDVDALMVTEYPFSGDYFDGSQPGCSWEGTPHASKSGWATGSSSASSALITLSSGTWDKVWWAKGRLWAVDTLGNFYALPAVTDTVTTADAFWPSGKTDANWLLADTPGPVLISDGSTIYTITLETDGLIPTVGIPTTTGVVPNGETITSLRFYLGYLILTTTRGVRVAALVDGQVVMGALTIKGDFSASKQIGLFDTFAYAVGKLDGRGGDHVLCVVDLSEALKELIFVWSPLAMVSELASTASGAVVDANGRIFVWCSGSAFVTDREALATSGYLTTGFHRFGTLDGKSFSTVLVRSAAGSDSGGTISVAAIAADGTETSLGVVAAGEDAVLEFPSTVPTERVALKFTLTRGTSSTDGPTLLGYQLKALPMPKRQRMIRASFQLLDAETNRYGQTMLGDPKTRLQALEALESSNALVTFEDKIYGETGTAYIEALEYTQSASRDFGGTLWVTLRKTSA